MDIIENWFSCHNTYLYQVWVCDEKLFLIGNGIILIFLILVVCILIKYNKKYSEENKEN